MKMKNEISRPKSDRQLLEEINSQCFHLAEALDIVSNNIRDIKKENENFSRILKKQNIIFRI